MEEVNLIIALPDSLIHCLFTEWIGAKELVRLESAFCTRNYRSKLLAFQSELDWQGLFTEENASRDSSAYNAACNWIARRGFRTSRLFYHGDNSSVDGTPMRVLVINNAHRLKCATISNDSILGSIIDHCRALESFSCSFCYLEPHLETLLINNPALKELRLDTNRFHDIGAMLSRISCPGVTKLCFWHDVTTYLASLIVKAFPKLTDVLFDSIEGEGLQALSTLPLEALTVLDIVTLDGAIFEDCLEDCCFSELRELNVYCWSEDAVISSICKHSPKLHIVRLTNSDEDGNIHGRSLLHILSSHVGARLEELSLEFVHDLPDKGIGLLALCCPNLRELWIKNCDNDIQEESVLKLLSRCPKLTHLHIHTMECTSRILEAVIRCCPLMHTLKFDRGMLDVDETDLVTFVQRAKALKVFTLSGAEFEFPGDVEEFTAAHCKRLKFTVGDDGEDSIE